MNVHDTQQTKPLDAERARLRAQGYTDAEISRVMVARATGAGASPSKPARATTSGPGVGGQGVMSAVVSSFVAVMAYARGALPSIKNDCLILVGGSAPAAARAKAGGSLVVKAAVVLLIAYAVRAEWQQHIISATETAAAQAQRARAEAILQQQLTGSVNDVRTDEPAQPSLYSLARKMKH